MQFIISPAKKMQVAPDDFASTAWPQFLPQTKQLLAAMRKLSYAEAKTLWQCSDRLAQANYAWLQQLDLRQQVTPAVMSYVGLQYQSMAPDLLTAPGLDYLAANLRILSGFYGVLRPFDAIVPYRLEMGSRFAVGETQNLYQFWGQRLYQALNWQGPVINLASQEYAKAITPYLQPEDQLIDIVFGHLVAGQVKTRATLAKQARGAMVRFAAEHQVQTVEALQQFDDPHYRYAPTLSSPDCLVFLRQGD